LLTFCHGTISEEMPKFIQGEDAEEQSLGVRKLFVKLAPQLAALHLSLETVIPEELQKKPE
ncbi:MAG: hypothetical protein AAGJ35_04550, partial [Myxococcota bacterium]